MLGIRPAPEVKAPEITKVRVEGEDAKVTRRKFTLNDFTQEIDNFEKEVEQWEQEMGDPEGLA